MDVRGTAMRRDPIRQRIRDLLRENDLAMRETARALGHNSAYKQRLQTALGLKHEDHLSKANFPSRFKST